MSACSTLCTNNVANNYGAGMIRLVGPTIIPNQAVRHSNLIIKLEIAYCQPQNHPGHTPKKSKMAPLVPLFNATTLPNHVNTIRRNFHEEKRRKGEPVELTNCPLFEMVQYSCNPPQEGIPKPGVVVCKPVVRLFRRYFFF